MIAVALLSAILIISLLLATWGCHVFLRSDAGICIICCKDWQIFWNHRVVRYRCG
jgi:hypothetical protein